MVQILFGVCYSDFVKRCVSSKSTTYRPKIGGDPNMAAKFELKVAKNGKFHFNLLAGNGQIILQSEMYESKAAAENGIASIKKNASDDARYERKESAKGDPFFTLKAANHQVIGQSEQYSSKSAMENGIESVKKNAPDATIVEA